MQQLEHRPTSRVLDILELLASNPEGLTLTEIAESIGSPKSTILPILRTMVDRKFLYNSKSTFKYNISIAAFSVGSSYTSNLNALQFIKNEMKVLVEQSGEICQLGILDKGTVLYLAKENSDQAIRLESYVGKRMPAYCTALGKSLISRKTKEELMAMYPKGLKPVTSHSITDLDVLYQELLETRETNISYDNEEVTEHVYCLGTPICKGDDIVVGLSISTPTFRLDQEKIEKIKLMLLESKKRIETFFKEGDVDIESLTIIG